VNVIEPADTVLACTSTQKAPEITKNEEAIGGETGSQSQQHTSCPNPGSQWRDIFVHLLYLLNRRYHGKNLNILKA